MTLDLHETMTCCTTLSKITYLHQNDKQLAFENFKDCWNDTKDIAFILKENLFQKTVLAFNINQCENILIHNFLLEEAKKLFKIEYPQFLIDINDLIFKEAISKDIIQNIQTYMPDNFNIEEGLQISIKYGAWLSFDFLLENHVEKKQKIKIIKWAQKEFWQYAVNGYANINFIQKLINHPLSVITPIKQPIYTLIKDYNFSFINELISFEKSLLLFKEINIDYFYNQLVKQIGNTKNDHYKQDGMSLLVNSYRVIPFDFSNVVMNIKFKKYNPEIVKLIDSFILKDKLDLLPNKESNKRLKI